MATSSLSANPRLDHLRQQARGLQREVRAGRSDAADRVARQYPGGVPDDPGSFTLSAAQLVVAREHGFASWPKLKHYFDDIADHIWEITRPTERTGETASPDRAEEFCRLACLTYGDDDGPHRWERARRLLADDPGLTKDHIWAAAAANQHGTVRRLLAEDPARARQRGGPYRWTPLFYLAYSRLDPGTAAEPVLDVARLLLDAGADPNEGYLWNALPSPFTLLTGVFGEGEQGPAAQPRHPHSIPLARLFLEAGADPNDNQSLYNRMFRPGDAHLELLFEYGLGTGDGGPWKARLGEHLQTPTEMLRDQLRWAVNHDLLDRVRLLVRHGTDFRSAYDDGRTPAELARLDGNAAIVEFLLSQGADAPEPDPAEDLIAAAFRADRPAIERLRAAHPRLVDEVREARPALIVWAAANGRSETVHLLAELGFDVNAYGRGDVPVEQEWQTALHDAANQGNADLARRLLSLGADPNARDARFDATPLGWARHADQQALVELLEPITAEDREVQP